MWTGCAIRAMTEGVVIIRAKIYFAVIKNAIFAGIKFDIRAT
jgi:hypothetical protein